MDEAQSNSLWNYAESTRVGDWSMRSALVRFAQPEPVRAAELLELVRRLDSVLHHVQPDVRLADLARIARADPARYPAAVAGYEAAAPLEPQERATVPLLVVALELDEVADALAAWADGGSDGPPVAAVDAACSLGRARMDELGVPRETRPPGRGRP